MKRFVFLIFILVTPYFFVRPVFASDTLMSPQVFDLLQKQAFFNDALSATDPATLSDTQATDLIMNGVFAGALPQIGVVFPNDTEYGAATGLSGAATGVIAKDIYNVSIKPIDGVQMQLPKNPLDLTGELTTKEYIVLMTNKKGKGTVVYEKTPITANDIWGTIKTFVRTTFTTIRLRLSGKQVVKTVTKPSQGFGGEDNTVFLTVKLVNDANGNKKADATEFLVPWANVELTFTPVNAKK